MRFNIRNFSIFYRNLSLKRISCILLLTFLVYIPIYLFLVDIHHYYYVVNYFGTRIKLFEDKYKNSSNFSKINPTIFCLIKTHPHNIRINKTITTYNIWAKKCDNYRFVTLLPQELIPENVDLNKTIEVFNEFYMIQPKGLTSETHSYLTLKIYHAILFVYRFFPDYDWYHIVDDDAYVNIKSFKRFLRNKNPDNLVSYGHNFKLEVKDGFHSGGPGYALSNAAFTKLSTTLTNNIEDCPNTGLDDVDLNACLRTLGVLMGNSLDEQGKERFLNLGILDHFLGNYTLGHFIYSQNPPKKVCNF